VRVATWETTYGSGYADDLRSDKKAHLSWSSIWGGTLLGWGTLVLLSLVGALIGFATLDPFAPGADVGIGSYVWGALELIFCAAVGGFLAARFAGSRRRRDAAVHAAIGWALSMVAGALLASAAAGTAARAAAESTLRRPAAARTNGDRARIERRARTATAAVGAGTAIIALLAALAGGVAAAGGRRVSEGMRYGAVAGESNGDDQPTILPPTH
jgi:hypothetical protein